MKYYKHPETNEVYAYDADGNQDDYIADGLVGMSVQEVAAHQNPPINPQHKTRFSVLEFRDRFTHAEQLAIRQAQMTDMEVGLVYDNFQAAQYIDLEDPRVAAGLDLYEAKGLLAAGRKTELLTPEVIEP